MASIIHTLFLKYLSIFLSIQKQPGLGNRQGSDLMSRFYARLQELKESREEDELKKPNTQDARMRERVSE